MIQFVAGLIIGAVSSWGIAHFYYEKSSKELKKELDRLSKEIKEIKRSGGYII